MLQIAPMRSKVSFYLVLGASLLGSTWLFSRLISPPLDSKKAAERIKTEENKSPEAAAVEKAKDKLFHSIWMKGSTAKDRFGRDLKARAVIDIETQSLRALFQKGDFVLVKAKLDELLKDNPNVPEYVAMLSDYYLALDKFENAQDAVRRLLALDPKNSIARETLARTLAVTGNLEEAKDEIYKVLRDNPQSESALQKLIVFAGMEGSEEKGIAEVREYVNQNPKSGAAYSVLAEKFLERGETAKAFEWAEAGAKADPTHAGNHRLLAVHHAVSGNMATYLEESRLWAQFESNTDYRAAADLNLLQALQQNGRFEEAYDVALRVETEDPDLRAKAEEIISKRQPNRSR